jgi:hypothetical protein
MAVARFGLWSRLTGCIVIPLRLEACLEAYDLESVKSSRYYVTMDINHHGRFPLFYYLLSTIYLLLVSSYLNPSF